MLICCVVLGLMIISPNLGGGNNQDDFMRPSQVWSSLVQSGHTETQRGLQDCHEGGSSQSSPTLSDRLWPRAMLYVMFLCWYGYLHNCLQSDFITINIFPPLQMMYFLLRKGSSNQIIKDQWFPTTGRFTRQFVSQTVGTLGQDYQSHLEKKIIELIRRHVGGQP